MMCKVSIRDLWAVVLVAGAMVIAGCGHGRMGSAGSQGVVRESESAKEIGKVNRIRLEHVALNVEDPAAMAKWYGDNLGMKLVRRGPAPVNMRFISDAGKNMMLEIYNNPPDAVPDYRSMDPLSLHIAFMTDDVKEICGRLTAAGATIVEEPFVTEAGDEIAMLRDPWGVPIQFVKRAKPMLKHNE